MKYTEGQFIYIIDYEELCLKKTLYLKELDYGPKANGYKEHVVVLPNGEKRAPIQLFTDYGKAIDAFNQHIVEQIKVTTDKKTELEEHLWRLRKAIL